MLTKSQTRGLTILRDHGPMKPRQFARRMWPDSPGWRTVTKCGPHGSTRGGGMNLAGGAYLGKLYRKGWTRQTLDWCNFVEHSISTQGLEALREETAHDG